jgi:hypothetical protein
VAGGGEGEARLRAVVTVESGDWLDRASHVPTGGGQMETERKAARIKETSGDDGEA